MKFPFDVTRQCARCEESLNDSFVITQDGRRLHATCVKKDDGEVLRLDRPNFQAPLEKDLRT